MAENSIPLDTQMDITIAAHTNPDNIMGYPVDEPQEQTTDNNLNQLFEQELAKYQAEQSNVEQERYNYWQSKFDKLKNQYEKYSDIFEVLDKNPDKADAIRKALYYTSQNEQQQQVQQTPERSVREILEEEFYALGAPPTPPTPPPSFNINEALNDPNSPSARYYNELAQYQQQMLEYNNLRLAHMFNIFVKREEEREAERRKAMEEYQRQQQELQRVKTIADTLKRDYKMVDEEVADFLQFVSNPDVKMEDLISLYRISRGKVNQMASMPQQPMVPPVYQQRVQNQQIPPSIAVMSGTPSEPISFEQALIEVLNQGSSNNWIYAAKERR